MAIGIRDIRTKIGELFIALIHCSKEKWQYVVLIIFIIYGGAILFKGILAGVYLTDSNSNFYFLTKVVTWVCDQKIISESPDSYAISFFASAEQDYWFFLIIGLTVSIPTLKSPKTYGIRAKVSHFFPTLKESSPYMEEILSMMNKASCVTKNFHRKMTFVEIDGDLFKAIVDTRFTLVNLHHNHSLDHNIGNFKIKPDETVLKKHPSWGMLTNFNDAKGNVICQPNRMDGESFSVDNYNIKLEAGEEREYNCQYTIYFDKKESLKVGFIRFTESVTFEMLNQTSKDIDVCLKVMRDEVEIDGDKKLKLKIKSKEFISFPTVIKNLNTSNKVVLDVDY